MEVDHPVVLHRFVHCVTCPHPHTPPVLRVLMLMCQACAVTRGVVYLLRAWGLCLSRWRVRVPMPPWHQRVPQCLAQPTTSGQVGCPKGPEKTSHLTLSLIILAPDCNGAKPREATLPPQEQTPRSFRKASHHLRPTLWRTTKVQQLARAVNFRHQPLREVLHPFEVLTASQPRVRNTRVGPQLQTVDKSRGDLITRTIS